jgi:hypothetical protein
MLNALMHLKQRYSFEIDIVDVDLHPELLERYDEMVPVLTGVINSGSENYLCHYHFDNDCVLEFISNPRLKA